MKRLGLIMVFVMAMVLLVGCNWLPFFPDPDPVEPVEVLSADVIVVEWVQLDDEPDPGVDPVYDAVIDIEYLITNTGTVDIDFSKILFEVTYVDFKKDVYEVWFDGIGVEVGCYESGYLTDVWVGSREVADVEAVEWELASYGE